MQTVRLYGCGAALIQVGGKTIVSVDGHIDVPAQMMTHLIRQGWTRDERTPEPSEVLAVIDAPAAAAIEVGEPLQRTGTALDTLDAVGFHL